MLTHFDSMRLLAASLPLSALLSLLLIALLGSARAFVMQPAYNHAMGVKYALLSGSAYCSTSSITAWNCPPCRQTNLGLTRVTTHTNAAYNAQAYVGYIAAANESETR